MQLASYLKTTSMKETDRNS